MKIIMYRVLFVLFIIYSVFLSAKVEAEQEGSTWQQRLVAAAEERTLHRGPIPVATKV